MQPGMQAELDKVVAALGEFYARETWLLENDLGERTLTHRLAVHLEKRFEGWDVDCNYDRLGERTLRLPKGSIVSTDDRLGKSIFPDIVVHRRAIPENLLAIEVRKATNHQPPEHDQHKLRALTDPHLWFAYRIGVFLVLGKNSAVSDVYVGGVIDQALSDWLAEGLKAAGLGWLSCRASWAPRVSVAGLDGFNPHGARCCDCPAVRKYPAPTAAPR